MAEAAEARDPLLPVPHRIVAARRETDETFTVELEPAHGAAEARPFLPGQFNMLYVFGVGEAAISISGDPARPERIQHTTREVGYVTRAMGALRRGGTVGVRGPFGRGWPLETAEGHDVVLVAGGIGLAPLRPALLHVLANRRRYGRVALLYGTRSPADILYRREFERWRAAPGLDVLVTVDRAAGGWQGSVGAAPALVRRAPFDPRSAVAMVCGPEVMMRYVAEELRRRGVDPDRIYVSMERNMRCAVGFCGHCQFGPHFVCRDGPVFPHDRIAKLLAIPEI